MAQFRGALRSPGRPWVTRLGHKTKGLEFTGSTWNWQIKVTMFHYEGQDRAEIWLRDLNTGREKHLASIIEGVVRGQLMVPLAAKAANSKEVKGEVQPKRPTAGTGSTDWASVLADDGDH